MALLCYVPHVPMMPYRLHQKASMNIERQTVQDNRWHKCTQAKFNSPTPFPKDYAPLSAIPPPKLLSGNIQPRKMSRLAGTSVQPSEKGHTRTVRCTTKVSYCLIEHSAIATLPCTCLHHSCKQA